VTDANKKSSNKTRLLIRKTAVELTDREMAQVSGGHTWTHDDTGKTFTGHGSQIPQDDGGTSASLDTVSEDD